MRLPVVQEVRLLGCVVARKKPGPGWVVGEVYERTRGGEVGEELARPEYPATPEAALQAAVRRARGRLRDGKAPPGAAELVGAFAAPEAAPGAGAPDPYAEPGQMLRQVREAAGLSKRRLSILSGVDRRTIRDTEAGRTRPNTTTMRRLIEACDPYHG